MFFNGKKKAVRTQSVTVRPEKRVDECLFIKKKEDIKTAFIEAYNSNHLESFLRGEPGYMIYLYEDEQIADPYPFGYGNLMFSALRFGIVPAYKQDGLTDMPVILMDSIDKLIVSDTMKNFEAGYRTLYTMVGEAFEKELDISEERLERSVELLCKTVVKKAEFFKSTKNHFGRITYYEEFLRGEKSLAKKGKRLLSCLDGLSE